MQNAQIEKQICRIELAVGPTTAEQRSVGTVVIVGGRRHSSPFADISLIPQYGRWHSPIRAFGDFAVRLVPRHPTVDDFDGSGGTFEC